MRLEQISVSGLAGLKGWTGEVELSGVDIFAGPNGAGKSTRLLAALAGLRGLGETPSDLVREYLGPELPAGVVDLTFDDCRLSRVLADGPRTAAAKKADAIAEQLVGGHIVRWDLGDFATATPASRQKLLDRICDLAASGWTVERLQAELPHQVALAGEENPDRWLDAATNWARQQYTEANALKRTKAAEVDALQAEQATDEPLAPAELDDQIAGLRQTEAGLLEELRDEERAQRAQRHRQDLEGLRAQLQALPDGSQGADVGAASRELREARAALREARDAHVRLQAQVDASANAGECVHCGGADPLGLHADADALRIELERARQALEFAEFDVDAAAALEQAARQAADVDRRRTHLQGQISRLEADLEELPPVPVDGTEARAELAEIRERLAELQRRRDAAVRASERDRMLELAIAARDEAAAHLEQVKELGQALKELKARLTEQTFVPLQREADAIVGPVLGGQVVFHSGADFGLLRDTYVPWWSLSDGERAVVGAGISYAMARLGNARWRAVLLDGAEAIDAPRLEALLEVLAERVRRGDLDNALVAVRADQPPATPPGVHLHWLGDEQSKEAAA